MTLKHSKLTSVNKSLTKNPKKNENTEIFSCQQCSKEYKSRVGLWKHKNKCTIKKNNDLIPNEPSDKDLIMILIKENSELKTMMLEQSNMVMKVLENGTHNNNSHNTTNSHNKAFNLNFFLNETCKDAMNIMDFVDSIKLQLNDLEKVGEIGYVEGISNIITTNLKALDITQRPIHCTDKKRDVLYVKDEDKWEKEAENKNKLRKAIKKIASKNQRLIPDFKIKHPDCGKAASKFSDQYNKIIVESMGGSGDNDDEKEDKIIKNISKATIIDKTEELI
jgi:antitoxin component HigA of HigAB toxin-antitoxin module